MEAGLDGPDRDRPSRRRSPPGASRGRSAGRRSPAIRGRGGAARRRAVPARRSWPTSSAMEGIRIGVSSTSIDRRRRRLATSMQAFTVRRRSQASNLSGSRNPGRSRQARTMASWTASRASSPSRRIRRAAPSSRATAAPASTAKASLSPCFARMTRSRWSTVAPRSTRPFWSRSDANGARPPERFPGIGAVTGASTTATEGQTAAAIGSRLSSCAPCFEILDGAARSSTRSDAPGSPIVAGARLPEAAIGAGSADRTAKEVTWHAPPIERQGLYVTRVHRARLSAGGTRHRYWCCWSACCST